jgi:hypothetical protein
MYHLLAATAGLTSSTIFFTMNTTLNYIALPSILLPALPQSGRSKQHSTNTGTKDPESSTDLLLRQWELIYATGHLIGPFSAVFSPVAFLTAAATLPTTVGDANLKTCYYFAALCAGMAFPFTVLFVLSTNNELYRRAELVRKGQGEGKSTRSGIQGTDTLTLIRKCHFMSKIRAVMPLPAIIAAVYAISRTGKVAV